MLKFTCCEPIFFWEFFFYFSPGDLKISMTAVTARYINLYVFCIEKLSNKQYTVCVKVIQNTSIIESINIISNLLWIN